MTVRNNRINNYFDKSAKPDVKKLTNTEANIFYQSLLEMIIEWKQEENKNEDSGNLRKVQ